MIPISAGNSDANMYQNLILPRETKPNRHSRPGSNSQRWVLKASDKPTKSPIWLKGKYVHDRIQTCNLLIRSQTPYPLDNAAYYKTS
ncbi:hypothetical protein TNCV_2127821 [Trichonephila clavipes]|nr:hypothetical protein TNCV_2127821 [Trichonephila clavipes]